MYILFGRQLFVFFQTWICCFFNCLLKIRNKSTFKNSLIYTIKRDYFRWQQCEWAVWLLLCTTEFGLSLSSKKMSKTWKINDASFALLPVDIYPCIYTASDRDIHHIQEMIIVSRRKNICFSKQMNALFFYIFEAPAGNLPHLKPSISIHGKAVGRFSQRFCARTTSTPKAGLLLYKYLRAK